MSDKKEFPIIRWAKDIAQHKWRHSERWMLFFFGGLFFVIGVFYIDAYFGSPLSKIVSPVVAAVSSVVVLLLVTFFTVVGAAMISVAVLATYYIHANRVRFRIGLMQTLCFAVCLLGLYVVKQATNIDIAAGVFVAIFGWSLFEWFSERPREEELTEVPTQ